MTNTTTSNLVPLVIPSGGMSTRYPIAAMPPQFSPWIQDFDNEGGFYESRKGMKRVFNALSNYTYAIQSHPTNKNRVVYVDTFLNDSELGYYDAISGVRASIALLPSTVFNGKAIGTSFNKNAYFFFNGSQPTRYDGTTYQYTGYTGPTMANIAFGFSYKSRMYLVPSLSTSTWYGGIGFVTGPTKEVNFASLTQDQGIIVCGFSFTLSSGLNSESLFALVFDSGEMLVFSGNYPDDVLSWNLVSKARIGSPLGYQSIIEQNGDVLVLTRNGIVSCRTLLTTAQGDIQAASITSEIEKYWVQLTTEISKNETLTTWDPSNSLLSYINGSFHQQRNKLVIFIPKYLKPTDISSSEVGYEYVNASAILVYDISTKSWVIQVPNLIGSTSQYVSSYYWANFGKLLFGSNDISIEGTWEYGGRDDNRDEVGGGDFAAITPQMKTAFVNTNYQTLVKGVFISHQGSYAKQQMTMQIVGDSGASFSAPQQSNIASNNKITRDLYDVGLTAENISLSLSTTTDINGTMETPYRVISLTGLFQNTRSPT